MKDKILYLILGVLIGAIITSLIFIFVVKDNNMKNGKFNGMERGERPENMGNFVMTENVVMPEMKEGRNPNRGEFTPEDLPTENE